MEKLTNEELVNIIKKKDGFEELGAIIESKKIDGRLLNNYTEFQWRQIIDKNTLKKILPKIYEFKKILQENPMHISRSSVRMDTNKAAFNFGGINQFKLQDNIKNDNIYINSAEKSNNSKIKCKLDELVENLKQRQLLQEESLNNSRVENIYNNSPNESLKPPVLPRNDKQNSGGMNLLCGVSPKSFRCAKSKEQFELQYVKPPLPPRNETMPFDNVRQHQVNTQAKKNPQNQRDHFITTKSKPINQKNFSPNIHKEEITEYTDIIDEIVPEYDDEGYLATADEPIDIYEPEPFIRKAPFARNKSPQRDVIQKNENSLFHRPLPEPPLSPSKHLPDRFGSLTKNNNKFEKFTSLPLPPKKMLPFDGSFTIPINEENGEIKNQSYYRDTDRRGSELLLNNLATGGFLVRPSRKFQFTLSVKYEDKIFHIGITKENNKYQCNFTSESEPNYFNSIKEMINFYLENPLHVKDINEKRTITLKNLILPHMT